MAHNGLLAGEQEVLQSAEQASLRPERLGIPTR